MTFKDQLLHGMTIRESADDGSDFTNPAADYRRLFLGEDGTLKVKNSAGTVSQAGGAALGAWTDYTPAFTTPAGSPNIGSSTLVGRYKLLDSKTVAVQIAFAVTTGGAWNAGSGNWEFSLPAGLTPAARIQIGSGHVLDSGTAHYVCIPKVSASATKIGEILVADSSGSRIMTNTLPVTWATGDQVNLSLLLEIV